MLVLVVLMINTFSTKKVIKDLSPRIFSTDPYLGKSNAKVTLVIFTDFECEYCRAEVPILKSLMASNQNSVKLVYKDYPLSIHKNARRAAEIARCAQDQGGGQGKFWAMHDQLFQNQDTLGALDLEKISKDVDIDSAKLKACLDSQAAAKRIDDNIAEGQRLNVTETPTLFVNERRITGLNEESVIQTYINHVLQ